MSLRWMSPLQSTDWPLPLFLFCIRLGALPAEIALENALPWLTSLSCSLSVLSTIFSKWAKNEWEERKRGSGVRKREMERGELLIVTGQSYWEPDDDTSASLWRCGDEVMGWWWHLEMEGWRWRGRWRANAYRLWPLGSEMPLSWQGWVERPLKAWGSSSDLTTISP